MFVVNYKYEGAACEIKTLDNREIAVGVLKRSFDDCILIRSDVPLAVVQGFVETTVKVEMRHGTLATLSIIGKLDISKMGDLKLTNIELLSENNQREYYRVLIKRSEQMNLLDKSGMVTMRFKTDIIDMSLGGAMIESPLQLPIGREANLEILLENNTPFTINGKIVRKIPSPNNKNRYGVKFCNMDSNGIIAIGMYLFKVQEENDANGLC